MLFILPPLWCRENEQRVGFFIITESHKWLMCSLCGGVSHPTWRMNGTVLISRSECAANFWLTVKAKRLFVCLAVCLSVRKHKSSVIRFALSSFHWSSSAVAIQCLETTFKISSSDCHLAVPQPLREIFLNSLLKVCAERCMGPLGCLCRDGVIAWSKPPNTVSQQQHELERQTLTCIKLKKSPEKRSINHNFTISHDNMPDPCSSLSLNWSQSELHMREQGLVKWLLIRLWNE